jgi:hypothetical protein
MNIDLGRSIILYSKILCNQNLAKRPELNMFMHERTEPKCRTDVGF